MSDIAIRVEGLGKQYRIGGPQTRYKTIRESLMEAVQAPFRRLSSVVRGQSSAVSNEIIWALKDVSFEVQPGEVVGIIGRNGAGKTTLLKILTRITEPTEGRAELHGRVGSLLEVGTGFHPELTGRENIILSGAILGMKRAEIDKKFDEIVDFSGVEKFIDTPVKHYSSGMYVRLAFAVAAHLEPEILLVDEVLAVGDAAFQKKCLGKMGDVAKSGRTVLFVSHDMASIENLCNRVLFLDEGQVRFVGDTVDVITRYMEQVHSSSALPLASRTDRRGDGRIRLTGFHLEDGMGERISAVRSGQECHFVLTYQCSDGVSHSNVVASFLVKTTRGMRLFIERTNFTGQNFSNIPPKGEFVCHIPKMPLVEGQYVVDVFVAIDEEPCDWINEAAYITVEAGDFFESGRSGMATHGHVLVDADWSLKHYS